MKRPVVIGAAALLVAATLAQVPAPAPPIRQQSGQLTAFMPVPGPVPPPQARAADVLVAQASAQAAAPSTGPMTGPMTGPTTGASALPPPPKNGDVPGSKGPAGTGAAVTPPPVLPGATTAVPATSREVARATSQPRAARRPVARLTRAVKPRVVARRLEGLSPDRTELAAAPAPRAAAAPRRAPAPRPQ